MTDSFNPAADALFWCLPSIYGERYALATCDGGSVLLDLESGAFYRLNATAAAICQGLARERPVADIARDLAAAYQIPPERASRDVEALLAEMRRAPAPAQTNPIQFEADAEGFLLRWQGREICHLDPRAGTLSRRAGAAEVAEPNLPLLWAAPHLLALRGQFVLHASAVRFRDEVLAFGGPSGVGKTTLARVFAEGGAPPVAEDLVLLALDGARPEVILGGEAAVRDWAGLSAAEFAAGSRVPTGGLARACEGPRAPLRELWFLGRSGAGQSEIRTERLSGADALVLLLENGFAELGQKGVWKDLFRAGRRLAAATPVRRAWCPEGVDVVRAAVAAYR